jgi:hypothetical protein
MYKRITASNQRSSTSIVFKKRNKMKLIPAKPFTPSHRKENKPHTTTVLLYVDADGKIQNAMEVRVYHLLPNQDGMSRVYAAFWLHIGNTHASGTGWVGGCGYCKQSAAASEAIANAGFETATRSSGAGMGAIEKALLEIATFHGINNGQVFTFPA